MRIGNAIGILALSRMSEYPFRWDRYQPRSVYWQSPNQIRDKGEER
jgi:hypothetical protein